MKFNGVPAIFKVDTDTTISTSVPAGATSGPISVTTPGGTGYSASSFTVIPPPTFTSFSPTSGCAGTPVIITGASFTGATSVKFNGVPAIFKVDTDTTIKTTVPNGATNGPISVTTPGGTGESTTFRVTHLVFTTQPGGAPAWSLLSPQPTVSIVDSANGVVTDFTGAVTVAIKPGTGTPGAELIGQTTVNAVAGVATFTDLRISKPGTGYVLTATADKVPAVDSHGFNVSPYASVIYRVNKNAAGPVHDGKSWSTAFQTVQAGVDAAARGDEVWVAASTPSATAYMETIRFKDGVGLYGGFAGTETDRSQRSWRTNVTVLGGAVTMQSTKAVLDGFTVSTGGTGVVMASGAATITNCIFRGNTYSILLPTGASGRLANVTNCTLSGNQYGVYMDDGSVNVVNCTISGNSASGLYAYSGTMTATNCIVAHNVWGVNNNGPAIADFSHNNVFGNAIDYLDFPDPTGSNGNIKQDPMLSDRFRDVHIQPGSPCIDAGDDSVLQADWYDIDGQSRKLGVRVDIGSDESDGTSWPVIPSRTWYVATTGNDVGEGLSWATAKRTVGAALAVAWNTDEVWVAQGTYLENVTIPMGVSVFGGFAGTETSRTQRDWGANVTRLDGNGNASSDVVRVPFLKGVLDGFTVCNGRYGLNVVGEVEIANCNLISNLHSGVYLRSRCTSMISDCSITGNAENGVQVDWNASNASIHRCDINENRIGVLTSLGAADISNCILSRNRHSGVYAFRGNVTVTNCTATDNAQSGMHAYYGTITVRNCITAFNIWGISQDASAQGTAILSHNSSFGNFSSNYMNFPDSTGTNGNISVDPLFVDRSNNDYRLMMNSPCIDAGDDSVVPPGATDLDGNPRIMGLHVDMGAYEFGSISYSLLDAATVLRIVGGLQNAASSDFEHLNVDSSSPRLDILDAARIARKVAGLEPNP